MGFGFRPTPAPTAQRKTTPRPSATTGRGPSPTTPQNQGGVGRPKARFSGGSLSSRNSVVVHSSRTRPQPAQPGRLANREANQIRTRTAPMGTAPSKSRVGVAPTACPISGLFVKSGVILGTTDRWILIISVKEGRGATTAEPRRAATPTSAPPGPPRPIYPRLARRPQAQWPVAAPLGP